MSAKVIRSAMFEIQRRGLSKLNVYPWVMNISVILKNIEVTTISSAKADHIKHNDLKIYCSVVKKIKPFNGPFPIYNRVNRDFDKKNKIDHHD